ncbi:MAG: excinuclease ABC subunit UvrA [Candidatus Aminicenantes bacterium]|nr:excinuclease ABC subunit UvrA [Candidatus Aminicenantes bacterium]
MKDKIILRGARLHNLKNIDLDIPLHKLIVVTGVSGSGKSSLAFDTLYAEGQRRYIESLSAYARQFLERMEKPDADLIDGITPAIAIQQKAVTKNPRSTVATVTEIYDFLRVLFARIGIVHCLKCGNPVQRDTIDAIVETLYSHPPDTNIFISFSWPLKKGLSPLKKDGFSRIIKNNAILDIDQAKLTGQTSVDVLVDRMSLDREDRERLVDSLELAMKKGEGKVKVQTDSNKEWIFSSQLECKTCHIIYEDPFPNLFSFNSPQGACPTCHGFGDIAVLDEEKIIPDPSKSLEDGAIEPWTKPASTELMRELLFEAKQRGIPTDIPFYQLKKEWKQLILEGGDGYFGVKGFFDWLQTKKYKVQVRVFLSRYRKYVPCPECSQMRLNQHAMSVKIAGRSIGEIARMTVQEVHDFLNGISLSALQKQVGERLIAEIQNRLKFLLEVGLDYITLDRMTFTLSGGEAQRINLAAALGSSLVGTLFVLDEPSIGLHARDNHKLIEILKSLKAVGNTVLVVEHDPEIIRKAEYVIDLGPGAGEAGGEVVFAGPMKDFLKSTDSLTALYLRGEKKIAVPEKRRMPKKFLVIKDAYKHNLKHLNVSIPINVFTCVTGVSGSGKSTLLYDVLYKGWTGLSDDGFASIHEQESVDKIIMVDQSPLSTSPRSIPATYTKAMDDIREVFSQTREAKVHGLKPGFFSFNTPGGRCEECKGAGQKIVEMQFLSDVVLTCESCNGKRFKKDILEVTHKGKNIDDILRMSLSEAYNFFADNPKILKKLSPLIEVGLGYIRLGQPTTTLSGGELQRIKLAFHLIHHRERNILYLFDEPTIGLHPHDISALLRCFQKLVNKGHTVVVIEHNLDVIKCADYIIDLGPEGGEKGGEIVVQGPPEKIIKSKISYTARYLKNYL